MPEIERAQRDLTDLAPVVLAVNVGEDRKKVSGHLATNGYGFRVLLDPDWKLAERFGIVALPVTFLIDGQGIVRERLNGGNLTHEMLIERIRRMVASSPSS
jgi:peroxiredoxin